MDARCFDDLTRIFVRRTSRRRAVGTLVAVVAGNLGQASAAAFPSGCPPLRRCGRECCNAPKSCCGGTCCLPGHCCGDNCCDAGDICTEEERCCTPDCTGKTCGDDGCGGSCGTCEDAEICQDDRCCIPTGYDCEGDRSLCCTGICAAGGTCMCTSADQCPPVAHGWAACTVEGGCVTGGCDPGYVLCVDGCCPYEGCAPLLDEASDVHACATWLTTADLLALMAGATDVYAANAIETGDERAGLIVLCAWDVRANVQEDEPFFDWSVDVQAALNVRGSELPDSWAQGHDAIEQGLGCTETLIEGGILACLREQTARVDITVRPGPDRFLWLTLSSSTDAGRPDYPTPSLRQAAECLALHLFARLALSGS